MWRAIAARIQYNHIQCHSSPYLKRTRTENWLSIKKRNLQRAPGTRYNCFLSLEIVHCPSYLFSISEKWSSVAVEDRGRRGRRSGWYIYSSSTTRRSSAASAENENSVVVVVVVVKMEGSMKVVKYMLFAFNLLFAVSGDSSFGLDIGIARELVSKFFQAAALSLPAHCLPACQFRFQNVSMATESTTSIGRLIKSSQL